MKCEQISDNRVSPKIDEYLDLLSVQHGNSQVKSAVEFNIYLVTLENNTTYSLGTNELPIFYAA